MTYNPCSSGCGQTDHSPNPYAASIPCAARANDNYRTAFWTGHHLQMTLMCIPVDDDIGLEMHPDVDQCIRVEAGKAIVKMGPSKCHLNITCTLDVGDAVFVPCGTWHNILNDGDCPLKLSSIYAPPQHPWGTVQPIKEDAES